MSSDFLKKRRNIVSIIRFESILKLLRREIVQGKPIETANKPEILKLI